jgi:hypothetical protein
VTVSAVCSSLCSSEGRGEPDGLDSLLHPELLMLVDEICRHSTEMNFPCGGSCQKATRLCDRAGRDRGWQTTINKGSRDL